MAADGQALVIAGNRERYAAGHEQPRVAAADREQTPPGATATRDAPNGEAAAAAAADMDWRS